MTKPFSKRQKSDAFVSHGNAQIKPVKSREVSGLGTQKLLSLVGVEYVVLDDGRVVPQCRRPLRFQRPGDAVDAPLVVQREPHPATFQLKL